MPRAIAAAAPLIREGGFLYAEAGEPLSEAPPGYLMHRASRAGAVHFHLLRRGYTAADEPPRIAT
jgi:hypothetical protein